MCYQGSPSYSVAAHVTNYGDIAVHREIFDERLAVIRGEDEREWCRCSSQQ